MNYLYKEALVLKNKLGVIQVEATNNLKKAKLLSDDM
jgi:hypothetical protein